MRNLLHIFFIALVLVIASGCTQTETVALSESNLANTLYVQNSPSGGAQKQYYFTEDTLKIDSPQKIKPDFQEGDDYEDAISEEYFNIQVYEEKDSLVITGDDNFRLEFKKIADNLLEDMDGIRFIRSSN